jgi:hypothetical protein
MTKTNNTDTLRIGRRVYEIVGEETVISIHGETSRQTELRGKRGAKLALIERAHSAMLIHFGRMSPGESIPVSCIHRGE